MSISSTVVGVVRLAELVEMFPRELWIGLKLYLSQIGIARRYSDLFCKLIQQRLWLGLDPDVQLIFAGGHVMQMKDTLGVSDAVVGSGESQYNRAHLRVDIAKDVGHAFAREGYCSG